MVHKKDKGRKWKSNTNRFDKIKQEPEPNQNCNHAYLF